MYNSFTVLLRTIVLQYLHFNYSYITHNVDQTHKLIFFRRFILSPSGRILHIGNNAICEYPFGEITYE